MNKTAALIAAGGASSRMNGEDKLFTDLCGVPVIIRAVKAFEDAESISEIIIAAKAGNKEKISSLCEEYSITKLKAVVSGGKNRQESVLNALKEVSTDIGFIAVHDGARPLIKPESIEKIIKFAYEKEAVIPAVRVKDTIKTVQNGKIIATPDRSGLYAAQTPQVFKLSNYKEAIQYTSDIPVTDDAMLMAEADFEVFITEGDYNNIKITTPDDLIFARSLLAETPPLRIGTGYDVHKFADNRRLILCGVEIPHEQGLLGYSDADVPVHALMDALLGASALGDIGMHFPAGEPEFMNISSLELLRRVILILKEKNYAPSNIDITIIADHPKLAPYITEMRKNLAKVCKMPLETVSVKATTEEGLGLAGKGIGANAVCMVKERL
ncbi:MAG: 2-C-methyl-D-erythritol 4-phosphate cytidylyltransferase [Oscillospiraceae bacterium]|nr:2-C-methyl-D-erythritol 4-phosphate cytidylyltransferase [Oscillospiraceae bacterium]